MSKLMMDKVLRILSPQLDESSLSRVFRHNEEHDCGALTAFRIYTDDSRTETYTKPENIKRNKSLYSKLLTLGREYSITTLKGKYVEGGTSTTETSFFVVDIKDTGKLKKDLMKLGEEFEQDSILFIPKGSVDGKDKPYLIGTNHSKYNDIGYHTEHPYDKARFGVGGIYSSYVNGRPMIFERVGIEDITLSRSMNVWTINKWSKQDWRELELSEHDKNRY